MKKIIHAIILTFVASTSLYADNGLVLTPPMGWSSWNVFGMNIDENKIKGIADAMVSSGMRDAGYIYLNIDDNWMAATRDANGKLQANPETFPSGMKALGDYIHSKGLKFGLYGDRGKRTCGHMGANHANGSGSYGNEELDAATLASWGVDYFKYDNCDEVTYQERGESTDRGYDTYQKEDYTKMATALQKTGRDIVFSICAWGFKNWAPGLGNLWRTTGDIENKWGNVAYIINVNNNYYEYAGPGHWNDPDILEVGNGVLTVEESRTHISMWAMMAAPLISGSDLRSMSDDIKAIYTNAEMISIDQDSLGIPGHRIKTADSLEVWVKPLGSVFGNKKAIALYNPSSKSGTITFDFNTDVGISGEVYVHDIWHGRDLGKKSGNYSATVPSHGVILLRTSPTQEIYSSSSTTTPSSSSTKSSSSSSVRSSSSPTIPEGATATPPMGWNSWNAYGTNVSETDVKKIADKLVSSGMRDAGYIYVNLDDNWMAKERDSNGKLQGDPARFPNGMKALADYIHSKGLKFGIYAARGEITCAHISAGLSGTQSGSFGNEALDAATFAEWGVDFVKYSQCGDGSDNLQTDFSNMAAAIKNSGKDMVFAVCTWGFSNWAPDLGNLWRFTGGIEFSFGNVTYIIGQYNNFYSNIKQGHWADPDVLIVGHSNLSLTEAKTQISMWAMMSAPLISGVNLSALSDEFIAIYTNPDIIEIDQDIDGNTGHKIAADGDVEIWHKHLGGEGSGEDVIAFYNPSDDTKNVFIDFEDLGLSSTPYIQNVWEGNGYEKSNGTFAAEIPAHGTVVLKISARDPYAVSSSSESSSCNNEASSSSMEKQSLTKFAIQNGFKDAHFIQFFDMQGHCIPRGATQRPGIYIARDVKGNIQVFRTVK